MGAISHETAASNGSLEALMEQLDRAAQVERDAMTDSETLHRLWSALLLLEARTAALRAALVVIAPEHEAFLQGLERCALQDALEECRDRTERRLGCRPRE